MKSVIFVLLILAPHLTFSFVIEPTVLTGVVQSFDAKSLDLELSDGQRVSVPRKAADNPAVGAVFAAQLTNEEWKLVKISPSKKSKKNADHKADKKVKSGK